MAINGNGLGGPKPIESEPPITEQVRQVAADVAGQAQEKLGEVAGQAKVHVAAQLDGRKHAIADGLDTFAGALRSAGDELRDASQLGTPLVASFAADRVDEVASYLRDRELGEIVADAENIARRNPAIFVGGAFLLGVFIARLLKSSSQESRTTAQHTSTTPGATSVTVRPMTGARR